MVRRFCEVCVVLCEYFILNIVVLIFCGDDLYDFLEGFEGGYIKLILL